MSKICIRCEARFETENPRKVYCSPACQQKGRSRVEKICQHCGKAFYPYSERKQTSVFCSQPCFQDNRAATPARDPVEFFHTRYEKRSNGCWTWVGNLHESGYGTLRVDPKNTKQTRAHRFSYELHKGPIPEGILVCHSCDTPACVNPDHLWLGTNADNIDDMVEKVRHNPGTLKRSLAVYKRKLEPADVLAIRGDGRGTMAIARHYGISKQQVQAIRTRKSWASL